MRKFNLNEYVKWKSQSQGYKKEKIGKIIEIVKPNESPKKYKPNGGPPGLPRNHESYIVKVGYKTYWPLVKYLILLVE